MLEVFELDNPGKALLDSSEVSLLLANLELSKLIDLVSDNGVSAEDGRMLVSKLKEWLDYAPAEWDWLGGANSSEQLVHQLQLAVALFSKVDGEVQYELMRLISYYSNARVPWSSEKVAVEAEKIPIDLCASHMRRFVEDLKPELLKSTSNKLSAAGYARPKAKSALRPTLGFSGGSAGEETIRRTWKQSGYVKSLSSICLLVQVGKTWTDYDHYWPLATTFILNVLDDSDPLFRTQGCYLLGNFIIQNGLLLTKSGLDKVFKESVEVCLSYLPKLSPASTSLHLLKSAYPVLYQLLQLQNASYLQYLDVLEKNLLGLISHVQGRDNDSETVLVLIYLVDQLRYIITQHVGTAILACFSRTNFVVSQLLINPYAVEAENGPALVDSSLKVHSAVLDLFEDLKEQDGLKIILLYKYDLLSAWTVLCKRVVKYNVGSSETGELIPTNVSKLREIAIQCGGETELQQDLQAIWTKAPETKEYVH